MRMLYVLAGVAVCAWVLRLAVASEIRPLVECRHGQLHGHKSGCAVQEVMILDSRLRPWMLRKADSVAVELHRQQRGCLRQS